MDSWVTFLAQALGKHAVEVETGAGRASKMMFTVVPAPPTLTAVTPPAGARGEVVPVQLTGTNFVTGQTTVMVQGAGLTVTDASVASETTIDATVRVDVDAEVGAHPIRVTTPGGTSGLTEFRVVGQPNLVSMTPSRGAPGTTVTATLTGSDFVSGMTEVTVEGPGVSVGEVMAAETSLTAVLTIASDAPLGERQVRVMTPGGTSGALPFEVAPPVPTLTGLMPNAGAAGSTVAVTLSGTGFRAEGTSVQVSGIGVTVSDVNVVGEESLTAKLTIASGAAQGARNVTVTTAGGTSNGQAFTVLSPAPTIVSVVPTSAAAGTTVFVTITGSGFSAGATSVALSGSGVAANNLQAKLRWLGDRCTVVTTFTQADELTHEGGRHGEAGGDAQLG